MVLFRKILKPKQGDLPQTAMQLELPMGELLNKFPQSPHYQLVLDDVAVHPGSEVIELYYVEDLQRRFALSKSAIEDAIDFLLRSGYLERYPSHTTLYGSSLRLSLSGYSKISPRVWGQVRYISSKWYFSETNKMEPAI